MMIRQFEQLKVGSWVRLKWQGHYHDGFVRGLREIPFKGKAKDGTTRDHVGRALLIGATPHTPQQRCSLFNAADVRLSIHAPNRLSYLQDRLRAERARVVLLKQRADKAQGKYLGAQVRLLRIKEEIEDYQQLRNYEDTPDVPAVQK